MITIQLRGLGQVQQKVNALALAVNTDDVLDAAGALMLHRIKSRFLRQESTNGSIWPESKAAQQRRASGRGGGTLFDTGRLFHSLSLGRAGVNIRRIFTSVEYARAHQEGQGQEWREFLGFNSADNTAVKLMVSHRIRSAFK